MRSISPWVAASARSHAGVRHRPMRGGPALRSMRAGRRRQDRGAQRRQVGDRAAEDAERVEVVALQFDAAAGELAEARLVADDAAERRRADHRAAGLGAERRRHLEIGHRRGRAARRSARRMRRVVRVDRRAGEAVGEFGRDGLAHDRAAGHAQQRDAGGVGERAVAAVDRRAVLGRHVDGVDDVLDPDRQPGEQARPAGAVGLARLGQCLLRVEPGPGLHRLPLRGPLQAGAHQRLGGQRAGAEPARSPRRRKAGSAAVIAVLPGAVLPRARYRAASRRRFGGRPAGCRPAARPGLRRPAMSGTACRGRSTTR